MVFDISIVTYALAGLSIILIGWVVRLEIKIHRLLRGGNGKSLEDSIVGAIDDIRKMQNFQKESLAYFEDVEKRLGKSVQAVKTIRFNPFKGTGDGGNQSFSTAFVSGDGDGVVISGLHSRDRISIFSKPLQKYDSEFEMTDEEKGVIEEAKIHIKK